MYFPGYGVDYQTTNILRIWIHSLCRKLLWMQHKSLTPTAVPRVEMCCRHQGEVLSSGLPLAQSGEPASPLVLPIAWLRTGSQWSPSVPTVPWRVSVMRTLVSACWLALITKRYLPAGAGRGSPIFLFLSLSLSPGACLGCLPGPGCQPTASLTVSLSRSFSLSLLSLSLSTKILLSAQAPREYPPLSATLGHPSLKLCQEVWRKPQTSSSHMFSTKGALLDNFPHKPTDSYEPLALCTVCQCCKSGLTFTQAAWAF